MNFKTLKSAEAKKLIGRKVEWWHAFDHRRGTALHEVGTIEGVRGRNVLMREHGWQWLPDMAGLREFKERVDFEGWFEGHS